MAMITITFNPQNDEHVQILAQAMMDILNSDVQPEPAAKAEPTPEPVKEAPAKKPRAAKAQPTDAIATATGSSEQSPASSSTPTAAPTFTLEQVRAKLYSLKEQGKDVGALIAATGHPNLTAIPAADYPALMANAEKM